MMYKECEYCGAALDPGEECDCRSAVKKYDRKCDCDICEQKTNCPYHGRYQRLSSCDAPGTLELCPELSK